MNLVIIAAVIAVATAAKLDRTYLPPASAKSAGGSPGALQTPFSSNSFNQGLGGIPKGGFENDFKGVVVDAAAPGTRASGDGETGLGGPRTAYGSTNSKVGDAAFRGSVAGFRQTQQNQFENHQAPSGSEQNQIPDGQTAGTIVNAQSFVQRPGQSESNYQRSQELNVRDQNANVVRFDSDVGAERFSYSFETDNGISAEESGVAVDGVQAQGGFSYTGDDGQVYSVTYTADEGGYQPKGDHLPTPPPIPEEILKSLEQNARDEAAGLVDDGSYDAQKYNEGGDYTENDGAGIHNGRQPAQFGNRPESDASASGTFINQNNQPFVRPDVNGQTGQTGHTNTGSALSQFGASANSFAQASSSSNAPHGFGQPNRAIQQNSPIHTGPEDSENANTFVSPTFEANSHSGSSQNSIQGQIKPQQTSFGRPQSNSQTNGQKPSFVINNNNQFGSSPNTDNGFGQRNPSSQSGNSFGSNEYLPPVNAFNSRPSQPPTQRPASSFESQSFNQFSQSATKPQVSSSSSSAFVSSSQSNVETNRPQYGGPQNNHFSNNQKPAGSSSSPNFGHVQSNSKPSSQNTLTSTQSGNFPSFQPLQSTAQPVTELTTPFENNLHSQQENHQPTAAGSFNSQSSHSRPTQTQFGNQHNSGASQFTAPASTTTTTLTSSGAFGSRGSSSSNSKPLQPNVQSSTFGNQKPQSQFLQENAFGQTQSHATSSQNHPSDAQFAPSTQRPIFSQNTQSQGPDDSYYYNQPSKTFSTPNTQAQVSRFPNTPFDQANRVTQGPSFSAQSHTQASVSQGNFRGNSFANNNQPQGPARTPQSPLLSSIAPTSPTPGSTTAFNGITQASATSFNSRAPTPSSQLESQSSFSSFGRRPTQQLNNQAFTQTTSQQSFSKQTSAVPKSFSSVNRNQFQQQNSFQSQQPSNQQPTNTDDSPAVATQQYTGEIYEYNKPAQTLPPPTEDDKKAGFGQFGRQPTKPQFGQQEKTSDFTDSQSGSTQGRPQLATQSFGQKIQASQQSQFNVQANSRQQFGQQANSFGNAQPTKASSLTQSTNVENLQSSNHGQINAQTNVNANSQFPQQFGSRSPEIEQTHTNAQSNNQETGSQVESISRPSCCRKSPNAQQNQPSLTNQFTYQSQGQFGVSDVTAQGFKPDQTSAQSFAGKGEVFGGPRKPPSFDEKTGYHY